MKKKRATLEIMGMMEIMKILTVQHAIHDRGHFSVDSKASTPQHLYPVKAWL